MDYDNIPLLLKEIKKCLRRKGIKFQHLHTCSIITRTYTKELHPVIFSVDREFPNLVTIQTVPLNRWSFTCQAATVDEIIKKAEYFCRTIKSHLV